MFRFRTAKTIFYVIISNFILLTGRSPFRTQDPLMPEVTTRWSDGKDTYHLRDYCLEQHPLFSKFDRPYFMDHLLPDDPIPFRNDPSNRVPGSHLKELIEEVIKELYAKKKVFKHFKMLKEADFNARMVSGLVILKFKDYPFVLKLFIKTPETFVKPLSEGMIPKFFFRMGGGINRHLSGFTRVKNLEAIRKKIEEDPYWKSIIDTPRKWFFLPRNPRWIELRSKNIGNSGELVTEIPAIYGIVADFIENDTTFTLFNAQDRAIALKFANYLENRVDAHVDNFMVEKSTGKIVLIDTEHFPTMVGLKDPIVYNNYPTWYAKLSGKCVKDIFLRSKKARRELQTNPRRELFPC